MQRDNEFIRDLLLEFEGNDDWLLIVENTMGASPEKRKRRYHALLLHDAGLIAEAGNQTFRLTSAGHDYIEALRDNGIWERTKMAVAETGGNATIQIMKDLSVSLLKKKISDHTGLDF